MQNGHMVSRLLTNILAKSPKSILLLGPRQTGKSTLLDFLKPDLTINLNDDQTYLDFKSNPSEIYERIEAANAKTVFIDEIQRHPSLLNTLQVIIDSDKSKKNIKFYISGSSARKLKRGQANLLPGRIFSYEISGLCAAELDYKLDENKALHYGTLPEPYLSSNASFSQKLLQSYSAIYLREEIMAEAITRNLEGFSRFIMVAAENSGLAVDFTKVAKQAKIERKQCSRFYEILEDTLIANPIHVYNKTDADIVARPKYYFFDTGVLNGLLKNFSVSLDRKGYLFEHLVVNQIAASAKAHDKEYSLSYFRTRAGYEIDFILEIDQKIYAIEVKTGRASSDEVKKLEEFEKYTLKVNQYFMITLDPTPRKISKTLICNLSSFLKKIGL